MILNTLKDFAGLAATAQAASATMMVSIPAVLIVVPQQAFTLGLEHHIMAGQ
jgi:hypothetical protein